MTSSTQTLFYDFETTGLNPFHEQIIEYSFLRSNGTYITELINPEQHISEKITSITNITNEMVNTKPTISRKKEEIINFINESVGQENVNVYMIAHNNDGFDKFLLQRLFNKKESNEVEVFKKIKFIDTLHLAKILLPSMRSFSLKTLCKIFEITAGTHRALDDTKALQKVYEKLVLKLALKMNVTSDVLIDNPNMVFEAIYM